MRKVSDPTPGLPPEPLPGAAAGRRGTDGYDVLVVGGGPVGLLAGCELLRRGVRVRIVDRAPEPSPFPKALLVWPRTLDLFEDLGSLDALAEAGLPINAFSYYADREHLATFPFGPDLSPLCLPQNETERVLTETLHRLGGSVERGVRLLNFDGLDFSGRVTATDGVTAILEHADGRIERTRAPFVLGADGAGSTVRGLIGAGFKGSTYETAFALVDAHIEGELPPDRALYYQSAAGALVIVPLPHGVYRFFSSLPAGERVSVEKMRRIVAERGPSGVDIADPVWESVFRVHARHTDDYQLGRVFLAGDAAHIHSPAGGQGLNTGLQDAHNLAWRLAAVIRGEAPPELLDGYGPERAAVARQVVRDTDIQTRAWLVKRRSEATVRDVAFRLAERSGAMSRFYAPVMAGRRIAYPPVRASQRPSDRGAACRLLSRLPGRLRVGAVLPRELAGSLGLTGPGADPAGWSLVAVHRAGVPEWANVLAGATAGRPQLRHVAVELGRARPHTGCDRQGYYLVRPDGHVAAHGHTDDLHRLRAELRAVFGEPTPERPAGPSAASGAGPVERATSATPARSAEVHGTSAT
ncbi:monooxygenase [Streptomyces sp. 3MP-14]|uniref:Monooxygenase n=1 Tax=Streptomyces mimosae TaxID=2586635 RepID=A0A5N6A0Z5_9ACTN|nr:MULTISPECIES: FAD-dependent monooxygenase [Streptomyces]KAB8162125.1 monooxygenase [Streptomyces mimosae]KAB8173977.1 monooxygenase [Streptomyces sp. 3MP-14]